MTMTPGQKQWLDAQVGQRRAETVTASLVSHERDGDDTLFIAQPEAGGRVVQRYVDSDGPPGDNDAYLGLPTTLGIEGTVTEYREVDDFTAELKVEADNGDWAWAAVTVDRPAGEVTPEEQARNDAARQKVERVRTLRGKKGRSAAETADLVDALADLTLGT